MSLAFNAHEFSCLHFPSPAHCWAARGVRSAAHLCHGSPAERRSCEAAASRNLLQRVRCPLGPAGKGGRSCLAAARATGPLWRCEPCARGCLQSSKGARARVDGEASCRARQIYLHFSISGELSEVPDALGPARAHFYTVPVGGARGARMTTIPGHQKTLHTRRNAAKSIIQHAQQ